MLFQEMKAAARWGLKPNEYFEQPREDKAAMVAFVRIEMLLDSVLAQESKQKQDYADEMARRLRK